MSRFRLVTALLLTALLSQGVPALRAQEKVRIPTFGALETASPEASKAQALAWLKSTGKTDAATMTEFDRLWKLQDRSILERVADTLALGDATAAKLLTDARNPLTPAPTAVPAIFTDAKAPAFYRANLALAYARLLSNRRVHEEALETLKIVRPDQVVDPAAYLFHRAVCEHALLQRDQAGRSIVRLLDEAATAPERYKAVAALMLLDMQTWKEKDLGAVARKMENIERRLGLDRGGPQTQKLQKEVVARLDELIKELENKAKKQQQQQQQQQPNEGGCPDGAPGQQPGQGPPQGSNNPTSPASDAYRSNLGGPGHVDPVKFRRLNESWGALPERERARALQELTRGLTSSHREAIENYFRNIAGGAGRK